MNMSGSNVETTKEKMAVIEKKLLASILHTPEVKTFALENELDVRFFNEPNWEKIMKVFNSLANGNIEPTFEIMVDQLEPANENEAKLWHGVFEKLQPHAKDLETCKVYIQMLKKQYKIKKYMQFADELKELVDQEKISPLDSDFDELDKELNFKFADLLEEYSKADTVEMTMAQGYEMVLNNINEGLQSENTEVVSTGYPEIDKAFNGGNVRGTFNITAGRPGSGKTAMLLNESVESALKGAKNIFISIEMTAIQCFQRIISKVAQIDGEKLTQPTKMEPADWKKLKAAAEEVTKLFTDNFWLIEVTELSISKLHRIVQKYKKRYGRIDYVYLDYIQIMSTEKGHKPETETDYAAISEGLRRVSKSEDIIIQAGSQLSRKVEERQEKKPLLSDLRNTGSLEQDAYRVTGLYRDEYYNKDTEEANVLEYIILKNRSGATTTIKLKTDLKKQSIYSMMA